MTLGRTRAVAVMGIDGIPIEVEADSAPGLPAFTIVGMPDTACRQAPDRVRSAAANSELQLPRQRVTVNLSPASLPKQGSGFDVAIAIAALAAGGVVDNSQVAEVVHIGELGLDGAVRAVPGVLPAVLAAAAAGFTKVVVPAANAAEAALVPGVQVLPVTDLRSLVSRYRLQHKGKPVPPVVVPDGLDACTPAVPDLADVVGQFEARFALEAAAAGGHHMAMVGPPGAGKTMLAERLPGLLPPLGVDDALQVTAVHSVLGALGSGEDGRSPLLTHPPFVAPHHGASMASVVGGGSGRIRPGAISRAHRGVLFMDEAPEFRRDVLDALRQPLESGSVTIARADRLVRFPARFQLVLAANPCPCGAARDDKCSCSAMVRRTYLGRLSGPLLDRVDVRLKLLPVSRASLAEGRGESTASVADRVRQARATQAARWSAFGWRLNADVPGTVLRAVPWRLPKEVSRPLDEQLEKGTLTLRGYDRCLRLAWTLADLAGEKAPGPAQVGGASTMRSELRAA
ncbi:YifB family Mg chelatase-like AAA ATPase [Branchiibius cervicis]|uniref:YifB family Mg chelatase-like AAA ATPase n=1 Tax=Branchiibius cervicis TaxID=908252 RepID=A0ABW2ATZ4_9MICO